MATLPGSEPRREIGRFGLQDVLYFKSFISALLSLAEEGRAAVVAGGLSAITRSECVWT